MLTDASLDNCPAPMMLGTFACNPFRSDGLGADCPTVQIHRLLTRGSAAYEAEDDAAAMQLEAEASALEPCTLVSSII